MTCNRWCFFEKTVLFPQNANNNRQSACIIKSFHQKSSGGHKVNQGWNIPTKPIPIIEEQLNPRPPGDGDKMQNRIGGTANSGVDTNGIFKSGAGTNSGYGLSL